MHLICKSSKSICFFNLLIGRRGYISGKSSQSVYQSQAWFSYLYDGGETIHRKMPQSLIVDNFSENKNVKFMGGGEKVYGQVSLEKSLCFSPQNLDFLPSKFETRWDYKETLRCLQCCHLSVISILYLRALNANQIQKKIFAYFCHLECSLLLLWL